MSSPATLPPAIATTPSARRRFILLLIAVAAISPLGINIYLPSMPGMAHALGVDYAAIQVTLSVYLAAVAVGQLVVGPLSDRFGRRPVLLVGMTLYILGSVVCAFADSVAWLLMGRVVQALGGCTGITLTRTMVRDIYDRNQSASMIGYVTMGMSVAPMVAPAIGGLLETWYGWRASFFFLVAFAVPVMLLAWARLHETNPYVLARRRGEAGVEASAPAAGATPMGLWASYRFLLGSVKFWGFSLITSFSAGVFFAFVAGAAYVVIELMGRSPVEYGLYFGSVSLGYIVGNYLSGRYAAKVGPERMIALGTALGFCSVCVLALGWWVRLHHPLMLFVPMAFVAVSNGMVLPSAVAGAVSVKPQIAGTASGLAGSLQIGFAALVAPLVGWLLVDSAWPLIFVMMASSFLAMLTYRMVQ